MQRIVQYTIDSRDIVRRIVAMIIMINSSIAIAAEPDHLRARDLGIPFDGTPGQWNAITDVEGVLVGHATVCKHDGRNAARTGVTAVLPNRGIEDVYAAVFRHNGNGEMTGTHVIENTGYLASPVLLTNTISVGTVHEAAVKWSLKTKHVQTVNIPVVAETWDGDLNDIYGFHVKQSHVFAALNGASSGCFSEGNVGGGTGMIAHGFKGGIGTSSRRLPKRAGGFVVGVLVQANHGDRKDFRVAGIPVGRKIKGLKHQTKSRDKEEGSIIVVVATDAPLLPHQLKSVAKRPAMGLARNGSFTATSSGDLFIAFSTVGADASQEPLENRALDKVFRATVQATEEAIINAMIAAETMTGISGNKVYALPHEQLQDILRRHRRLSERDSKD